MRFLPKACWSAPTLIAAALAVLLVAAASAHADYTVSTCGQYTNDVYTAILPTDGSILQVSGCPMTDVASALALESNPRVPANQGTRGAWQATAPAGLEIVGASASVSANVNNGGEWSGGVYWQGGSATLPAATGSNPNDNLVWSRFASPYFGFQIMCEANPCDLTPTSGSGGVAISQTALSVRETVGPSLSASGLWQTNEWVRGAWPLDFSGDSPSGVCALSGTFDGVPVNGTGSQQDFATWHQCSAPPVSTTINTPAYAQGAAPLVISGSDAAGKIVSEARTVQVDNSVPTLTLSGPSDAPSTGGAQFVTATAGGSPSGIEQIVCSVDGGPAQSYSGAVARVVVIGVGEHQVSCTAYDNAVDGGGVHGASQTQTRSIKIGTPTVLHVTFLKDTRVRVLVRVPVKRHGMVVKRHGKVVYRTRVEHGTAVVPSGKVTQRVAHGRATTVSGWLGTTGGTPLAGQTVEVLTAPDSALGRFARAAEVITAANGTWTVSLPAGPSRLIEASYAGTATTEQAASGQVTVLVPSKIKLTAVTPNRVAWGQTVTIKGQLLDGYLPKSGINVRLRIGIANAHVTFGVKEHVAGDGNLTATYTFGPAGDPAIRRTYWFQIASLPAGDYPYTPAASNHVYVQVGGHA